MQKKINLVFGVGIRDVDYIVQRTKVVEQSSGEKKQELQWVCPYYTKWLDMLRRSYSKKFKEAHPTYNECHVDPVWFNLSNFIKWVDIQPNRDWQDCHLDKDLLYKDNKFYSPEKVVFISSKINGFLKTSAKTRGASLIGVSYQPHKNKNKPFLADCRNPFGGSSYIGYYATEIEAHKAWQSKKHEYACQLAESQSDPRVAKALKERYSPDKDWTSA